MATGQSCWTVNFGHRVKLHVPDCSNDFFLFKKVPSKEANWLEIQIGGSV